ncbi:MAG: pantoate--beta-alanine ligase [Deltaproteobacteria bacterium]|nr:pantoate--beta-alanine ligase [Deltaproteobacteria bacterium]
MDVFQTIAEMKSASRGARRKGLRVGLVPTMGYLHEGHLALVRKARELSDWVAVSIFVNPTQFGPSEDLASYPRDLARDTELCRGAGADALFVPAVEEIYPAGFQTYVTVERLSEPLCGAARPGHFRGVATVVAKLFNIVAPDVAVFGEKDYQQLQVIRRMARDLAMDVEVVGLPTVREADGLAMSSRNTYLSAEERERAASLSQSLALAQELVTSGTRGTPEILERVGALLERAGGRVEYAELRDAETLETLEEVRSSAVLALAVRIGRTRLIDNRVLSVPV